MKEIIFSNRRITSRFSVKFQADFSIIINGNTICEDKCEIIDISYDGLQITFKNNDLLFLLLNCVDEKSHKLKLEFEYEEEQYSIYTSLLWIKINDIGEKHFIVISGLDFCSDSIAEFKEKKLDLLVAVYMEKIYLGSLP
jgi:hypothetical protein